MARLTLRGRRRKLEAACDQLGLRRLEAAFVEVLAEVPEPVPVAAGV